MCCYVCFYLAIYISFTHSGLSANDLHSILSQFFTSTRHSLVNSWWATKSPCLMDCYLRLHCKKDKQELEKGLPAEKLESCHWSITLDRHIFFQDQGHLVVFALHVFNFTRHVDFPSVFFFYLLLTYFPDPLYVKIDGTAFLCCIPPCSLWLTLCKTKRGTHWNILIPKACWRNENWQFSLGGNP